MQRMAHGWDSYFHNVQPLSSDPGTLRRTSETEGNFPQHLENFLGHHDFSGTGVSQETPVPNSNSSTNYCTNRGIENSNSDCGYETYCSDAQWQADGEHLGKDYLQRCENRDFPDFATDGLPASGSFPSSFAPDLQGLKQDCEMLSMSCLGKYSDVSSCSDTDGSETRPSCKFMGVDSFSRQNSSILSKDGSSESFSTETGNMTFQTDGLCPKMSETNDILPSNMKEEENLDVNITECVQNNMDGLEESVTSYRGHSLPSTTSSVLTERENVHARDDSDGFQNQKPEDVKGDFKGSSYPGFSVAENITEDEIDKYPVDKGEEDQTTLAAPGTFYNEQGHAEEKIFKAVKVQNEGFSNSDSVDDYGRNVSEAMQGKSEVLKSLKEESDSLKNKNSGELQFPVSSKCGDEHVVTDCQKKGVQKKTSPSTSPSAIQESKSKNTRHELNECTLDSSNHDVESSLRLPRHQSERVDQNRCCENLSKMSNDHFTDECVTKLSKESCLEPNNSSTDVPLYRDIKEVKEFTRKAERVKTASSQDLYCCNSDAKKSSSKDMNDDSNQGVASHVRSDLWPQSSDTETSSAKLSKPSTELDCSSPSVTDIQVCKDTGNVKDVDPYIYSDCSSPDIHLNLEVPLSPIEKKTPSCSPDPDCSSSVNCHSTINEENKKSAASHTDSCLQPNSSRTDMRPSLEMETSSQEKTQNSSPDQDYGNPKVTCDSPSIHLNRLASPAESCSQTDGSNTDKHPCEEMEPSPKVKERRTHSPDPACGGASVTHDSLSDNAADKSKQSLFTKPESQSQFDSSNTDIRLGLSQEWASPSTSKSTAWTNPEGRKQVVTSCVPNSLKSSLHQIASSTGINSHSDAERTDAGQNRNSVSFPDKNQSLHDVPMAQGLQSSSGDVFKNTGDLRSSTMTDQSLSGVLFGEPLSEDSSCDADETNRVSSQYKESCLIRPNKDNMGHLEESAPRLKSSIEMRKLLHPVVVLNTMESTNGKSHLYQCKDCQNTAHNGDILIEHHYCCHPMLNFKFCKTCNVFLLRNDQDKKHFCGVSKDEFPQKKRRFYGRHKCTKCGLVFSKILHYIKHMRGHTGKTPFRCNGCGLYFAQPGTLQRHQRVPGRCKPSQLPVTNSATVTGKTEVSPQKDVAQNISNENIKTCYVKLIDISNKNLCHFCGKMFKSVKKAKKHIYSVHKKKRAAPLSNQCATDVNSENIPNVENDTGGKFKCPLCPRIFKHYYNRSRHLRDCVRNAIYGGKLKVGDKYLCPLCKAGFTATSNRYRHVKGVCLRECLKRLAKEKAKSYPEAEQENTQENDQKPQSQEGVKMQRKKSHNPSLSALKPVPCYKCSLCPAVFRHPSGKYRHMKKHELFELTGKRFRYKNSALSVTSKPETSSCTKTKESADQLEPAQESPSPALSCRFCGKSFDVYTMLKKHERNHRGERPYRCLDCKKGFKQRSHLISHKMVHQKRIQCTVCKKILPTVGELIQHRRSHLNRGKLQCPECQVLFQYPAFLLRHLKTHRNKDKKPSNSVKEMPPKPLQSSEKTLQSLEKPLQSSEKPPLQSTQKPPQLPPQKPPQLPPQKPPQLPPQKPPQLSSQKPLLQSSGTTKKETGSALVQCSLCKEVFDDPQILRKHCLTHISASASNQCPFCNIKLADRRCVLRHMVRHTGDKPFSCNNCGKQFYRSIYLKLHNQKCFPPLITCGVKSKDKMKPYRCSICPRGFFKKDRWQRHQEAHKKKSLIICSKCGQYFGINMIGKHKSLCVVTAEHPKNDTLTTSISKERSLKTNKNECEIPPQSNVTKTRQFKCPYCTQRFKYRSLFLRHLISHTGVQPYACVHCGQRFGSQTMCLQHEVFCEGGNKVEEPKAKSDGATQMDFLRETTQKPSTEDETEFKCKFCTKSFMKARSLRSHILTHNEAKPYRCKACDSCFSRYDHLKVHQARCKVKKTRLEIRIPKISLDDVGKGWQSRIDIKRPEKQETFECKVCLRSFPCQAKLSRHFTMFHAVKPFKCARCGSSFSHEKTLKKHRRDRKCRRPQKETNDPSSGETNEPKEGAPSSLDGIRNRILLRIQPFLNKKLKYVCSYCPRAFKSSWQLHVHTRLHTGEKPYPCGYCGERFMRKDYVPRHHLKCTKKPQSSKVLCDRCGGFFTEDKLENHKKLCALRPSSPAVPQSQQSSLQSPPKGFSCAYCSSRFLLFSQLQEHFLSAHKLETANPPASTAPLQQLLSNIPNIKEEPVEKSCGEGLSESGNLICKLDTALNIETPNEFVCQECNMSFTNKAGLTGHQRVHSTELPFNCKICKRGFWNKFLLRNHYRKCRPNTMQQMDVPLKAEIAFALKDSDLLFKEDSKATTQDGDLETNISCKDASEDESPQTSEENQEQSSPSKEKKTVQYQCSECDKSFTDGLILISHLEDHAREEQAKKQNRCTKCGRVCSNQGNLEKHMKLHGMNQNYPCDECSRSFFTLSDVEKHKTSHDVTKPFSCKLCQQRFWTRPSLCEHYTEDHTDDVFKCKFCSKVYAVKKSLSRHYKKWHPKEWKERWSIGLVKGSSDQISSQVIATGESDEDENNGSDSDSDSAPYFPCHVCGKTFPTSESLEDHQLCHLGEKPHECAECGKCFFLASQLQQHQRMHKSEFQCQTCGRGFVTLFALRNHKHTHGKNRPHRCSKCQLSFTGPIQLAEHMSTHREESFPCDLCNKIFQSKSSRVEHRKSHSKSGDNPSPSLSMEEQEQSESSLVFTSEFKYRCGVCSERFRDPEELSEHGCMEAKERPYCCAQCNKHFLHASHLKKHRNTHLPSWSNREYPCNQCNSSFSSSQNFLNHLKSHVDATAGIKQEEETSDTLICPVCHQCFATATELIYHFPTHPDSTSERGKIEGHPSGSEFKQSEQHRVTSAAVYECTECGGKFLGRDALCLHHCSQKQQAVNESKSSNPSAKNITHQAAGERDVDTDEEEEEVDVTGEDLHKCPDCSMQFSSKSSLLEHQNKRHTNGKPFKCERCGKTFAKMPYLRKHESRHRLKETVDIVVQPPESKFRCAQCTAKFDTAQDLSVHMRLHAEKQAGEYRCDMCYKSFSQRSLLKHHQESHVGEVVYECTECDKAFAFPHLLEEHQQTHAESLQ